jgi:branched-chain amino acid transport system substrate-binding protein
MRHLYRVALLISTVIASVDYLFAEDLSGPEFRIGVIASLSGQGASRGASAQAGLKLAMAELAQSSGTVAGKIRLIYQDVPLNKASNGITAFQHLSNIDGVCAIIGPMGSTVAAAVVPLADAQKVPLIVHTASASSITKKKSYIFRLWPSSDQYAKVIIAKLKDLGWNRVGLITAEHENTIDLAQSIRDRLLSHGSEGVTLSVDENISPESADFRSVLTKINSRSIDGLFLNLFEGQIALAAQQARTLGIRVPFFTNAVMSKTELALAKPELEGIWFPRFSGSTSERLPALTALENVPSDPDCASAAHDALIVLESALRSRGCDRIAIADYIRSQSAFNGMSGTFHFVSGDATVPIDIYQVHKGNITTASKRRAGARASD